MGGRGSREAVWRAAWWGGLIVDLKTIILMAVDPALALLPAQMDTPAARVQMLAIGLQESRFLHRRQLGNGPARGLWQFERDVLTHPASRELAYRSCGLRGAAPVAAAVHPALETDDVLAAVFARLLMWTEFWRLPAEGDVQGHGTCTSVPGGPGSRTRRPGAGYTPRQSQRWEVEMLPWLERIKGRLLLVGLALAALASVFYPGGRATVRQAERQERQDQINEQAAKARQEVRNVQLETARMDDHAVVDELERDWVRGSGPRGR